jgi:hypothetical protein
MSQHTLTRIENILDKYFSSLIDMRDWQARPELDRRLPFLSRALAALSVKSLAKVDLETAAKAVTDGFQDNGIDAIYFDQKTDKLFLVQTKWSDSGTKPLDASSSGAFVAGVRDLLAARFDRFNEKIREKESEVRAALYSERPIKIALVTIHTATQPLSAHVKRKIDDLVSELNDGIPIAEASHYDQGGVYGLVTSESKPPKLKLQIGLKDWGVIEKPFLAYYGRVHVSEIQQWWTEYGNALFSQNLRLFYFSSDVNDALSRTLQQTPKYFWYFNNGITVICEKLTKAAVGSPGRLIGLFTCDGASIVNGAQTVGTIGTTDSLAPDASALPQVDSPDSWVQVRIISLDKCPPEFSRAITRAANLQNAVGNREFAAMDPVQHRLAMDFALDKRKYVYKQGEPDPKGEDGCGIVEATQALACARSTALAVQVKREIGALWADTGREPYTELFNEYLTSTSLWRCVLVLRAVDEELRQLRRSELFSADLIGIHLNRLILHLVFLHEGVRPLLRDSAEEQVCINAARSAARKIFPEVADYIEREHADNYLASFSKNLTKCDRLVRVLSGKQEPITGRVQGTLF